MPLLSLTKDSAYGSPASSSSDIAGLAGTEGPVATSVPASGGAATCFAQPRAQPKKLKARTRHRSIGTRVFCTRAAYLTRMASATTKVPFEALRETTILFQPLENANVPK